MIVVSNTSPIVALDFLGHLDLLKALFGQVLIPSAVRQELQSRDVPSWISVHPVRDPNPDLKLEELDRGEREAIALAVELGAQLTLLDDLSARRHAGRLGLAKVGTIGLLLRAKQEKPIENLGPEIERLAKLPFHLCPDLVKRALLEAGE